MDNSISNPLVSIFVASYNNALFVRDALDSVKNQTYKNIELIIIDDASKDNSVEVINEWIHNNDYKCKFLINEENLGVCKSSNRFLSSSTGEYISWLASDDIMMPEKIEKQVLIFNNLSSRIGVIYSDAFIIDENGERYFSKFIQWHRQFIKIPQGNIFSELLDGNYIPVMTALFKRECFEKCGWYDEQLLYEDYDMFLRISKQYEFIFSDYISAEYRIHSNNFHKRLATVKALETDFKTLAKHIGFSEATDLKIRNRLLNYIDQMAKAKSNQLTDYLVRFNGFFKNNKPVYMALKFGMPYNKILIARKIGINFKKIIS